MKILLLSEWDASWIRQDISILHELGNKVQYVYVEPKIKIRFFGELLRNIVVFIKASPFAFKSDVIFCWFAFPIGFIAILLGKLARKATIINAVGYEVASVPSIGYGMRDNAFYRPIIRWVFMNATKVIAISLESARNAELLGAKNVLVIYEGIDTGKFRHLKLKNISNAGTSRNRIILTVATLSETNVIRKGLITLLRAIPKILRNFPNAVLVIVGKKLEGYPLLKKLAERLGVTKSVIFAGSLSDEKLVQMYNRCEVFVLPSFHEGFPTVAAEALACGKPVISTAVAAIPEVVKDGQTGILVTPDKPLDLANAIKRVFSNKDLKVKLSQNARKYIVKHFSKELRKKRMRDLFSEIDGIIYA